MNHRQSSGAYAAGLLLLLSGTVAAQQATAYQIDRAHSGTTTMALQLPLTQRWRVQLPGSASYPLIANGRVFVLSAGLKGGYGTQLFVLDGASGNRLWVKGVAGTYFWAGHTIGDGRVYVVNFDGKLKAWDEATGALLWAKQLPGQYAFSAPPTFSNGVVYVGGAGSGGTLYAVDAATGKLNWTASPGSGDMSSPAVSDTAVYVSYACNNTYAFDAASGASLWTHYGGCSGGGGKTAALSEGHFLLARDPIEGNLAFDPVTGAKRGTFKAGPIPAVKGSVTYAVSQGTLFARDRSTGINLWKFALGSLTSAPIVVGNFVLVGDGSGKLYARDIATGARLWSANVGVPIPAPDEQNVSQPLTGLAAGEGLIVVPAGNVVTAFGN
ncbi:MAG: PQQ-binding-like beta-propeller repeat protein [Ideonella sp.]|nr:PQQ-binding-like beta-propeller repeat protein [Ideonella sp.]